MADRAPDYTDDGVDHWDCDPFELTYDATSAVTVANFQLDDRSFSLVAARKLHAALGWALRQHTAERPDRVDDDGTAHYLVPDPTDERADCALDITVLAHGGVLLDGDVVAATTLADAGRRILAAAAHAQRIQGGTP